MKRFLLSTVFALVAVASWAYDVEIDGIYYNVVTKAQCAEVTRRDYRSHYVGDVVIPLSIEVDGISYFFTDIGDNAFNDCLGVTSVIIPNSVVSIGDCAFYNCPGLTSINLPNSIKSIGESAFADCSHLTSINIPNSISSIGRRAFRNCSQEETM